MRGKRSKIHPILARTLLASVHLRDGPLHRCSCSGQAHWTRLQRLVGRQMQPHTFRRRHGGAFHLRTFVEPLLDGAARRGGTSADENASPSTQVGPFVLLGRDRAAVHTHPDDSPRPGITASSRSHTS